MGQSSISCSLDGVQRASGAPLARPAARVQVQAGRGPCVAATQQVLALAPQSSCQRTGKVMGIGETQLRTPQDPLQRQDIILICYYCSRPDPATVAMSQDRASLLHWVPLPLLEAQASVETRWHTKGQWDRSWTVCSHCGRTQCAWTVWLAAAHLLSSHKHRACPCRTLSQSLAHSVPTVSPIRYAHSGSINKLCPADSNGSGSAHRHQAIVTARYVRWQLPHQCVCVAFHAMQ